MICTLAELQLMAGLSSSITEEERAVLAAIHRQAEGTIKGHLHYDPEQRSATEYYPRHDSAGGIESGGMWDVNAAHTRAVWERFSIASDTLQLQRLPVRRITALYVDESARFGTVSGSFGASTAYTEGTDYWADYQLQYYAPSGLLHCYGSWPLEPGSVKVTYTAGYSWMEFAGQVSATSVSDSNSQISTVGIDASPIVRAIILTVVRGMNKWGMMRKHAGPGFAGMFQYESAGDYSYTLVPGYGLSLMATDLPGEAIQLLEPFVSYGTIRA